MHIANPIPFYSTLTSVSLLIGEGWGSWMYRNLLLFFPSVFPSLSPSLHLSLPSSLFWSRDSFGPHLVLWFHFQLILGKKVNSLGITLALASDSPPRAEQSFEPWLSCKQVFQTLGFLYSATVLAQQLKSELTPKIFIKLSSIFKIIRCKESRSNHQAPPPSVQLSIHLSA